MAKAKKKAKKKPAVTKMTRGPATKKAYHIFHFTERFEIKDKFGKFKQYPLLFTRDFVGSGTDDESIHYAQQMSLAEHSPNRHILRSVFYKLKNIAAHKSKRYRGYILEGFAPASKKVIAQWVGLDVEKCKEILDELLQIGLIEYVPAPDYAPSDDDDSPDEKPQKKKKPATTARSREKSPTSARNRKKSPASAQSRDSLQERVKGNGNGKGKYKKKKNTKKETLVKPALSKPEKAKGKAKSKSKPLHQQVKENISKRREQRKALAPENPKEPDAGEAKQSTIPGSLPSSLAYNQGRSNRRYSAEAKEFGAEVFIALRLSCGAHSKEGRSELGCFAKKWDKARDCGLSPEALTKLWLKSIQSAKKIAKQRNTQNPGRLWCYGFNRRLAARVKAKANITKTL